MANRNNSNDYGFDSLVPEHENFQRMSDDIHRNDNALIERAERSAEGCDRRAPA